MDWGAAASPIVHEGLVIFCQDDNYAPFFVAVDAKTGKEKWKTLRKDMLAGDALPVLCEANGRTDLAVAGSGKMKGYEPSTGKELWTCNTLLRTIMTSPVVHDGVIYIAVQSYGDATRTLTHALLEWLDTKQDKILARDETPSNLSLPLLFNIRLYLVKSGGMSSCYEAKDGKTLWDRSRLGNFGDYFASHVAADAKVFIADGRLDVRTRENLFCVAAGGSKAVLAENAAMPTTIELTSQLVSGSRV